MLILGALGGLGPGIALAALGPGLPAVSAPAQGIEAATVPAILHDVLIEDPAARHPAPLKAWQPPREGDGGLALVHAPGEALDAAWVHRQFEANALIGSAVPFDRIWRLVQLVNQAFVANGYVNSGLVVTAPVDPAGILRLRLVSGALAAAGHSGTAAVTVHWPSGRAGLSDRFIRQRLPSANLPQLNIVALERDFRLLADDPAVRSVDMALKPGAVPGEASLDLAVTPRHRLDVQAGVANSRTPTIGSRRISAGVRLRNLLSGGDVIALDLGRTSGLTDLAVSYATPFFSPETALSLAGGMNRAAVVDPELRALDIHSRDWFVQAGLARTVARSPSVPETAGLPGRPARSLIIGVEGVHRQVRSELLGMPFSFSPGAVDGRTEYTAVRMTANWLQRSSQQVLALGITATQGIEGTQTALAGVPRASVRFTTVQVQANLARRLDRSGLELRARTSGQVASGLLYSAERLAAGGHASVRGYRESANLGDEGVTASLELARPFNLAGNDPRETRQRLGAVTASVFADGAYVHNLGGQRTLDPFIASLGAALEWHPLPGVTLDLSYARALHRMDVPGRKSLADRGFYFSLSFSTE